MSLWEMKMGPIGLYGKGEEVTVKPYIVCNVIQIDILRDSMCKNVCKIPGIYT